MFNKMFCHATTKITDLVANFRFYSFNMLWRESGKNN